MDWFSVYNILLVVLSISGDVCGGGRKKIRIHIPQKVKHIHHHKKIYITKHLNQPTQFIPQYANSEQYASGYIATGESTPITPTIAFLPLAEGRKYQTGSSPAPNIQPLYRARGHYGPPHKKTHVTEIRPATSSKKIKIIKISEGKKKKIIKLKPSRIIIAGSPSQKHVDPDNDPTSSYREDFYSDIKPNHNTVKIMRKPKRVEKFVNGNTEHVHTYSEEHIHQIVYDQPSQSPSLLPLDAAPPLMHAAIPTAVLPSILPPVLPSVLQSPAAIQGTAAAHLHPVNAMIDGTGSKGSLGTPAHLEYMHYNPQDVTHDHIYHDHGEIVQTTPDIKVLNPHYTLKSTPSHEGKGSWVPQENGSKEERDAEFSYYENVYPPKNTKKQSSQKNKHRQTSHKYNEEPSVSSNFHFDDIYTGHRDSPIKSYYDNEERTRTRDKLTSYNDQSNKPSQLYSDFLHPKKPKSIKSLRQHHYNKASENKPYGTPVFYADSYREKENKETPNRYKYHTNIYSSSAPYEPDTLGSSSTQFNKEKDVSAPSNWRNKNNKSKKSVSSQNIKFGGQEHKMIINHETSIAIGSTESRSLDSQPLDSSPQPAIIDITYSPIDSYYNSMALKSFEGPSAVPDASNTNFRIVEAPRMREIDRPTDETILLEISTPTAAPPTQPTTLFTTTQRPNKSNKKPKKKSSDRKQRAKNTESKSERNEPTKPPKTSSKTIDASNRGKYKYGDRLSDRYDYEYDELIFI